MTDQQLTAEFDKLTIQLRVSRATYADIKEMNDFEPCPEAYAHLQKVVKFYNDIATQMQDRKL